MQDMQQLFAGALRTHGIAKQVTAALVLSKANEALAQLAQGPLAADVQAIVFDGHDLIIACRHNAAMHDIQFLLGEVAAYVTAALPACPLRRTLTRVSPQTWYNA